MGIRVDEDLMKQFKDKCKNDLQRPYSSVFREIMQAFIQGRLKITPTQSQVETFGALYDN
jgi:hypothetical protein